MYDPVGTIAPMWADVNYKSFTDNLAQLCLFSQHQLGPLHYTTATVSYHELGRKQIVDTFLGDWVLMLDTDHAFSPDLLVRMLEFKKKFGSRVVSGIYQYKHPPHGPVANLWTPDGKLSPLVDWDRKGELLEIGAVGAGCLLVDRSVFNEIKSKLKEDPFAIRPGLSEDFSFCQRCKELNIPIDLAMKIECHHVIRTILSIQDYRAPQDDLKTVDLDSGTIVPNLVK